MCMLCVRPEATTNYLCEMKLYSIKTNPTILQSLYMTLAIDNIDEYSFEGKE